MKYLETLIELVDGPFLRFSFLALFACPACTLYSSQSDGTSSVALVKECNLPSDQSGTISGTWPTIPIPIALHAGDFDATETQAIVTAADTWNQFYTTSKGIVTLDYGTSTSSPNTSNANDPSQDGSLCAQGLLQNGQFSGYVVIYKLGEWPSDYSPNSMAITKFCTLKKTPYNQLYTAVMHLNYQNFFVQGTKLPDLQTIVLHELGHLHGLNHSCEGSTKSGTPNCNDSSINPDYISALMFPSFTFDDSGNGEQKRALGVNDQGRANCLYP